MAYALRPLTVHDEARVLAINEAVVDKLAPLDGPGYRALLAVADHAWAVDLDGELAGFVLLLGPGEAYDSENYRWFGERHRSFWYLDRVAVDERFRRRGVAGAIYDRVEALATRTGRPVLLEVNVDPPNEASLAFHTGRGFRPDGTLTHPGPKVVTMMSWYPPRLRPSDTGSSG